MIQKIFSKTSWVFWLFLFLTSMGSSEEVATLSTSLEADQAGNTALHYAAKWGDLSSIPQLVEYLDLEEKNLLGETPIHLSILNGMDAALELLISYGANPKAPIILGMGNGKISITPLQLAILRGEKDCFNVLMKSGQVSLTEAISSMGNPLHVAIEFDQADMLQHLFDYYGEEVSSLLEGKNAKGQTPFSLASGLGCIDCMGALKNQRVNIEAEDFLNQKPIHHAAKNGRRNAIKYLAFLGAELEPRDADRKTPEDLASSPHIKNLLINLAKIGEQVKELPPNFEVSPPKNLVFKGGGAKGLCYVGAIQALEKNDHLDEVERVAGTSAGAISATLLAMGYSASEILNLSTEMDFESFLDHPLSKEKISRATKDLSFGKIVSGIWEVYKIVKAPVVAVVDAIKKLWHTTGICDGETAREWFEECIREKTKDTENPDGIPYFTFGELRRGIQMGKPYLHLHIFATKIGNSPEIVHYSSEDPYFDEVILSDALVSSMSIPGVFIPHVLHVKVNEARIEWPEGGQFLDGGILYNFPIEAFDFTEYQVALDENSEIKGEPKFNRQTLGFNLFSSLATEKKNVHDAVDTVKDLLKSVSKVYFSSEDILREMVPYNRHRVIDIDVLDVGTLDFKLPPDKQEMLVASGRSAVEGFFRENQRSTHDIFTPFHRLGLKRKNRLSIPEPTPQFVGRKKELDALTLKLSSKEVQPQTPNTFKILTGPKGMGKSELAFSFADKNLANYSLAWEIDCSTRDSLLEDYKRLAVALDIPNDSDEMIHQVHKALESWKSLEKPYLLIYRNLDERIPMPQTGGTILITSSDGRVHDKKNFLPINSMGEKESTAMLSALTDRVPSDEMKELAEFLNHSPPLLSLAGKYIKYTDTSFSKYQELLENAPISSNLDLDSNEQLLYKTLGLTMEELRLRDPIAFEIFCYSPFVHSSEISFVFLKKWLNEEYPVVQLDQVLMHLQAFSLVRSSKEMGLSVHHRITRCVEMLTKEDQKEALYRRLARSLNSMILAFERENVFDWEKNLLIQATALIRHPLKKSLEPDLFLSLAKNVASFQFHVLGNVNSALQIAESHAQQHIEGTPFMLISAKCLKVLGKPEEGLKKLQEALATQLQVLSPDDLRIAETYNEMGNCYKALEKPRDAITFHNKALAIRRKKYGRGHPDIGASINNIANCLKDLGQAKRAIEQHKIAMNIYTRCYGPQHAMVARSMNNIGNCFRLLQKPKDAMPYLEKACNILERSLGKNHPDLATCLSNIGDCYLLLEDKVNAKNAYEKAYEIAKISLGDAHSLTQQYRDQMGN